MFNYASILKIFPHVSSKYMCKQLCRWKLFIRKNSVICKWETPFFTILSCFDCHWGGEGSRWRAYFGVVREPMPTSSLAVNRSYFNISVRFLTNQLNIVKKNVIFVGGVSSMLKIKPKSRDVAKFIYTSDYGN